MIYHVQARFRPETAAAFLEKLTDGSIKAQRPDGSEIVASMQRAIVNEEGAIEWSEHCCCRPPPAHERATVLDAHFTDFRIEPVEAYEQYDGRSFMHHLRALAAEAS